MILKRRNSACRILAILYTDVVCPWLSPTNWYNVLECGDGNDCRVDGELGWDCCQTYGRVQCPANFPIMCSKKYCGEQRDQYCCAESDDKCSEHYSAKARGCDSKRRLFYYKMATTYISVIKHFLK